MRTLAGLLWLFALPALLNGGGAIAEVVALRPTGGEGAAGGAGGSGPAFAPRQRTAVRAAVGGGATLDCAVLRQGDKAVSWIRSRDLQILSHGGAVFTADARVSAPSTQPGGAVQHHPLRIAPLRAGDAGRYECQLNTDPKMSLFFDLIVKDEETPETETEETPEYEEELNDVIVWAERQEVHGTEGGEVTLACGARRGAGGGEPIQLAWLKDGHPVTLQDGVGVWSEWEEGGVTSRLRLAGLRARSAGRYTCRAGPASQAQRDITLVVEQTEELSEVEAMQRDQSGAGGAAGSAGRLECPVPLQLMPLVWLVLLVPLVPD